MISRPLRGVSATGNDVYILLFPGVEPRRVVGVAPLRAAWGTQVGQLLGAHIAVNEVLLVAYEAQPCGELILMS